MVPAIIISQKVQTFGLSRKDITQHDRLQEEIQKKIVQVKGLKGGHTSGWVKVPVGTEDKST